MPRLLIFLIAGLISLFFCCSSSGQVFIGKSKTELIKDLNKENKKITVSDQDSIVVIENKDQQNRNITRKLKFDNNGKCNLVEYIAQSLSLYQQQLNSVLDEKKYDWKKINENQYISRYKDFLMIEIPVEANDFSFTLFRTEWNEELYKLLRGTKD